jgi:hypothetical protein
MPGRVRKFIGMIVMLAFLAAYATVAMVIGVRLPDHWAAHLAFYAIAGTFWSLPLFPLIAWMQRGR